MEPSRDNRRLAAILFTDIVGYTALMQQDESSAVTAINRHQEVLEQQVVAHQGEVLQYYGDGSLSIFKSASEAVRCSMEIQSQLQQEPQVPLRIGIHIGEIFFKNDKVFGDGVNVASRIESMGVAGAVLFSKEVYSKIRNRPEFRAQSLGHFSFKNVSESMEVFALTNEGFPLPFRQKENTKKTIPLNWTFTLIALTAFLSVFITWSVSKSSIQPNSKALEHVDLNLPEAYPLALIGSAHLGVGQPALTVSPDGNTLAYVAETDHTTKIVIYFLATGKFHLLPETEGAYCPFFSPDGQWIAYLSNNQLNKVSIYGGNPVHLAEVTQSYGGSWLENGKILFNQNEATKLSWVSASGGEVEDLDLANQSGKTQSYVWPSQIPGTDEVLMFRSSPNEIYTFSLESGEKRVILKTGSFPRYLPTGHLIFSLKGRLMAVPFDKHTLQISGEPVPVLDHLRTETQIDGAQLTFSDAGTLFYIEGVAADLGKLTWVDFQGKEEVLSFPEDYYGVSRISNDGEKIASTFNQGGDIQIYRLARSTREKFVTDGINFHPFWSSKDEKLIFSSKQSGKQEFDLISKNYQDQHQELNVIWESDYSKYPSDISPDGDLILFSQDQPGTKADIWLYRGEASASRAEPLIQTESSEWGAVFSPDQRFIAYISNQSGQYEVYIQPFPLTGEITPVSSQGGEEPLWSPKGDYLYYRNKDQWVAVPVKTRPELQLGDPEILFTGLYLNIFGPSFDIDPKGDRFLMIKPVDDAKTANRIKIVRNWMEEVRRKSKTGEIP